MGNRLLEELEECKMLKLSVCVQRSTVVGAAGAIITRFQKYSRETGIDM